MKRALIIAAILMVTAMVIGLTGICWAGEKEDLTAKLTDMQKKADKIVSQKITAGCSVYDAQLQQLELEARPLVEKLNVLEKDKDKK